MLSEKIIGWYRKNKRDLPWRTTRNPYFIWLSEVILQQTRVQQGLPYYHRFISAFPTVQDLAEAPEDHILRTWQGLGYYSRARNLQKAARFIAENNNAVFPETYEGLLALPGIGPYTAAAIASFAFGRVHAVIDGNVYRVLSRIYEIDLPIDSHQGSRYFHHLANELIPKDHPADFNQGIMELGATVCLPRNPKCDECPVSAECGARGNKTTEQFPVKKGKSKVRHRYFQYLVITCRHEIYLQKREENDIWKGLYEFYLIETDQEQTEDPNNLLPENSGFKYLKFSRLSAATHILSHQHIHATFWHAQADTSAGGGFVTLQEAEQLPKSRLVDKFLLKYAENLLTLNN